MKMIFLRNVRPPGDFSHFEEWHGLTKHLAAIRGGNMRVQEERGETETERLCWVNKSGAAVDPE